MKRLIMTVAMIATMAVCVFAQNSGNNNTNTFSVEGNVLKSNKASSTHKADTLVTTYKYEDSKGVKYPIIINKNSGRCYIWKTSSKTGNKYKMYLKEEEAKFIAERTNIVYVEKKN